MTRQASIPVRVADIRQTTPFVKTFTFEPIDGRSLPRYSAGSHVVVTMSGEERTYRNPYSLMSSPFESAYYQVSVRREDDGRGGSLYMHNHVRVGDELQITPPTNFFGIDKLGHKHILIAGGIGITPFMAHMIELTHEGLDYELHYAFRNVQNAAFHDYLQSRYPDNVHYYPGDEGVHIDLPTLLAEQPLGTHVYVCGPIGLIEAVTASAQQLGWPASHIHYEEFAAPPVGKKFTVVLNRSGREIEIPSTAGVLETLENAGLEPICLCRGGVCGVCETVVIEGDIDHNDHFLSDEVKASNKCMMICVSRAHSDRVVLDL